MRAQPPFRGLKYFSRTLDNFFAKVLSKGSNAAPEILLICFVSFDRHCFKSILPFDFD